MDFKLDALFYDKMPYKIVQTIERGRVNLVIVPSMWEDCGKLWWPANKKQTKLSRNDQSQPNKNEWKMLDCILKRSGISTYELAETELSIMSQHSDTDAIDDTSTIPQTATVSQNSSSLNFELLANKLSCDPESQGNPCMEYTNVTATENATNHENIVEIISTETLNFDQILANQKILSEKIDNMLQIQAITLENQQKIVQKLATQSVQLDEIFVELSQLKESSSVTLLKDANCADNGSFTLKPIDNQRDLISLDQLLADKAERNKLQRNLSFLCSASKGEGKSCAYKLLDILFTRDFLCNCSWAGGSRGNRSKIALKDYKNVLTFFHRLVQTWDPTYTVQDNEQFIKIITKNSKQRKAMKNLRMSSQRYRKNRDGINDQEKNENKRQPNNDEQGTDNEQKKTEEESMQIEGQENEIENIYPNEISDDEGEADLC